MSGPDFLDTNVLVYAYDASDPRKQDIAQAIVRKAVAGEAMASVQVLAEFAATLLHKLSPPAHPEDVITLLDTLGPIKLVVPDGEVVRRAVEARAAYGLHFYDGMIVAAAERARCQRIWSEDLNPGQQYFGVTVVNPFKG
jgi:predicted nucleic acid-binding protein